MEKIINLVTMAQNACGSNQYRNYYVDDCDILKNGDLSCAWFVSSLLVCNRLIDGVSFTVRGLETRLQESPCWDEVHFDLLFGNLKPGDIIFWDSIPFKKEKHYHVGIYTGSENAISNRSLTGQPGKHHIRYTGLSDNDELNEVPILKVFRYLEND